MLLSEIVFVDEYADGMACRSFKNFVLAHRFEAGTGSVTDVGNYTFIVDGRRAHTNVDPITAQALLFHYLGGNDAAE